MSNTNEKIIEENDQYSTIFNKNEMLLMFSWKYVKGLSLDDFQKGITECAIQCKECRPHYAVIDASVLDQHSPAVAWLHGQISNAQNEDRLITIKLKIERRTTFRLFFWFLLL